MRVKVGQVAKAFMGRRIGCIYVRVTRETEAGYEGVVVDYDIPWRTKRKGDMMQILKSQVLGVAGYH